MMKITIDLKEEDYIEIKKGLGSPLDIFVINRLRSAVCKGTVVTDENADKTSKCGECSFFKSVVIDGKVMKRGTCKERPGRIYHDASQKACKSFCKSKG